MPELEIQHARLVELKDDLSDVMPGGKSLTVQFNPESLKLSYANQVKEQPNASGGGGGAARGGNQSQGSAARQFVGTGTTKLAVQLWFDVAAATSAPFIVDDVRRITAQVLYFIKPKPAPAGARDTAQRTPPGLRFSWGNFLFDGIVESMEENVEFFSPKGEALRASITMNMIQQQILVPAFTGDGTVPGARPLWPAGGGQSLQALQDAARASGAARPSSPGGATGGGLGGAAGGGAAFQTGGWQAIALANGIENPRAMAPGQLIDLSATQPRIVSG
ncbi:MAG: peptidoglycan-binding protein [Burkholderiales bacterium]|nr:MAG: peptidoglycan-binding protein [Burkholderiales bacterium]